MGLSRVVIGYCFPGCLFSWFLAFLYNSALHRVILNIHCCLTEGILLFRFSMLIKSRTGGCIRCLRGTQWLKALHFYG